MGGSLTAGFFLLQIWALPVNVFPFKFVLLGRDNGHCGPKLDMFFFSFQICFAVGVMVTGKPS
jgi:hypothetical protein